MPESLKPIPEKFESPEAEIQYLREKIREKERQFESAKEKPASEHIVSEEVKKYREQQEIGPQNPLSPTHLEGIVAGLTPETHDTQMTELANFLVEKGIKNSFAVLDKIKDPHLEDDFHRFLVQYLKTGRGISGLKEKTPLYRAIDMTLFEILLPEEYAKKEERQKTLKELISGMEQFYAGMLSIYDPKSYPNHFAIELAIPSVGDQFSFYVSVPTEKNELFEKHVISIFPNAKLIEQKDDYNIFNESGISVGSIATFANKPIFPIKTYEDFDLDPLNAILNSFSKVDKEGEGAAIQIIFSPAGGPQMLRKFTYALEEIKKGKPLKEAVRIPTSLGGEVFKAFKDVLGPEKKKKAEDNSPKAREEDINSQAFENIQKKISSPIVNVNIRLAASSRTKIEADSILADLESSFNQFENTQGNRFKFTRLAGSNLLKMLKDFSFRMYRDSYALPLNIKELTSVMHLPTEAVKSAPQLKRAKAGSAPAPTGLAGDGLIVGINRHRNAETIARITDADRLRHFYVIGQTGTGKSSLLKNLINQDIERGNGVCFIDPHGVDILDILANVPQSRYEDIIYFDPSYTPRPMGLNMLEYDVNFPEQKTFVVNELFSIFQKLYGAVPESMGPMFEQYFRNATMLVIEDPGSGNTLLDVSRVLSNKTYRQMKLSRCRNPVVVEFWRDVAEKAGGEGALANIVPYVTSKFDIFLANDIMRPIVAQEKSALNFRDIMDNRKILLVNLAKGRLGDINSNLLGLIIVGKILMAALSRVDSLGGDLAPFYLYIDEFQNVTTDSISTILSEARKYRLSLTIAHQFIAQLEENIRDAVFGNVGSLASFRVGSDDAEYLEKQFSPIFSAKDLMNIDNYNAYLKLLVNGRPVTPFSIEIPAPKAGNKEAVSKLKELSYLKYGRDRLEIEQEILDKHKGV